MSYISSIRKGEKVLVWERTDKGRIMKTYPAPWYFYTEAVDGEYKNIYGKSLKRHDFVNWKAFDDGVKSFKHMRKEIYESDIPAELKVLSQNYYQAIPPNLHISVYDIEIDYDPAVDFQGAKNPIFPINSISLLNIWENTNYVMAIPPNGERAEDIDANQFLADMEDIEPLNYPTKVEFFNTERELLGRFLDLIEDSDVISGWNSEMFDDPYTAKRIEEVLEHRLHALSFRGASKPRFSEKENYNEMEPIVRFSGRVNIDYLELYKKFSFGEEPSYKLESIAEKVLKDMRKLEFKGTLADLYKNDFTKFVRYNIRDTEILGGFERVLGFLNQANALYHNTTGLFHHSLKTLKNTELGMINYCHYVLDDLKVPDTHIPSHHSSIEGGYVIAPKRGQHDNLASVDMTALYPSSIRSNNISPETLIGQFDNKKKAFEAIHGRSDQLLNFQFEEKTTGSDQKISMSAAEWRKTLLEKGWGISGYGTVFNLKTKGILPGLLESWFIERKKTKALSIDYAKQSEAFEKDSPEYKELIAKSQYYDRIQQVMKLQLNAAYGSLCNKYFKFNDTRLGASTTATGQVLLKHQTAKVNELLTGVYDLEGEAIIYGDSVTGDSEIILDTGEKNIEDLFTHTDYQDGEKEYCNLDGVDGLTYDPTTNKSCFKAIKYVMRHKVSKQLYRVWLTNSEYIDVTEDHSLIGYLNTAVRTKNEHFMVEVKPHELGGRVKSLITLKSIPRNNIVDNGYSKEIYEFLGYIIGDGYAGERSGDVGLSVGSIDIDEITEKLLNPLVEQGYITSFKVKPNTHDVNICGNKIWKLLRTLLYPNNVKTFPIKIFSETESNIASFLRGYLSADGTITGNIVRLTSVNLDFIKSSQKLLRYIGLASTYFTESNENSYNGKFSGTFSKHLCIKRNPRFNDLVGFILDRKSKKIKSYDTSRNQQLWEYDFHVNKVLKVEPIIHNDYVYDIEIEDTHTFFANGILVHNTDSSYFKTFAKDIETATKVGDAVGLKVNESFPAFMRDAFLCTETCDKIIETDREIIGSSGIFMKKKMYIVHVVNDEGKKVDKVKAMGIALKKSTLPKEYQVQLSKFVEQILKKCNWDDVAQDIVDYKESLQQSAILRIGLPIGVKNMVKYTNNWKNEGYKTFLPGNVAASVHWNIARERNNDNESIKITTGTKIKVYYLKTKYYNKFKSIAIPTDATEIPSWFTEDYLDDVDVEAQLFRLIDKPLLAILSAIGKDVPSKQQLSNNSLVE